MRLRRLLLLTIVLYCGSLTAHYYAGYEWRQSNRPPLTPSWHVVGSSAEVRLVCGHLESNACVAYEPAAGLCHIYAGQSESKTPDWLRWHEYLHCAGWDHT